MMPPVLAPFSARLMARPRFSWNHMPRMLVIAASVSVAQPIDMRR